MVNALARSWATMELAGALMWTVSFLEVVIRTASCRAISSTKLLSALQACTRRLFSSDEDYVWWRFLFCFLFYAVGLKEMVV
jgi:hypothetical protein